jgi:hypothetical protein
MVRQPGSSAASSHSIGVVVFMAPLPSGRHAEGRVHLTSRLNKAHRSALPLPTQLTCPPGATKLRLRLPSLE